MTRLRSAASVSTRRLRPVELREPARSSSRHRVKAPSPSKNSSHPPISPSKHHSSKHSPTKVKSPDPVPKLRLRRSKAKRPPSSTPSDLSSPSSTYSVVSSSTKSSEDKLAILETCALKPVFVDGSDDINSQLFGYENHYDNLLQLLKNCIERGDSNCALICGGRGSGKTTLVNSVLKGLMTGHELKSARDKTKPHVKVIRLNGYVHLNDVQTLKLIASTLELRLEGTETMLYEIPAIMDQIKKLLLTDSRLRIIIILDEFDIFCRRQQTLLYNLFDASQQTGSISTLCLTTRLDCLELLEKRVKSRMSQRIIHLTCPFNDLNQYLDAAKKLLKQKNLTDAQRKKLAAQFSMNKSYLGLQKCIIDIMMTNDEISPILGFPPDMDPKLKCLYSLSTVEISVLLMASQYCKDKNKHYFTTMSIMENIPRLPAQYIVNKSVLYKALNRLSHLHFIIPIQTSGKASSLVSEWTEFMLGIDDISLNETLDKNPILLPVNVRHSLSLPS